MIRRSPRPTKNFTVERNEVMALMVHHVICPEAYAVWCYLVQQVDHWKVVPKDVQNVTGYGRTKVQKLFNQLKDVGLMSLEARRGEGGRIGGTEWIVYDQPTDSRQDKPTQDPETSPSVTHSPESGHSVADEKPEISPRVQLADSRLEPTVGKTTPLVRTNLLARTERTHTARENPDCPKDFEPEPWTLENIPDDIDLKFQLDRFKNHPLHAPGTTDWQRAWVGWTLMAKPKVVRSIRGQPVAAPQVNREPVETTPLFKRHDQAATDQLHAMLLGKPPPSVPDGLIVDVQDLADRVHKANAESVVWGELRIALLTEFSKANSNQASGG